MNVAEKQEPPRIAELWDEVPGLPIDGPFTRSVMLARQAWEHVRAAPLTAVVSIISMAVALLLVASFLLFLQVAQVAMGSSQEGVSLHVYLKDGSPQVERDKIADELRERAGRGSQITFIPKGEALIAFRKALGEHAALLDGLGEDNPLPDGFEVKLKEGDRGEIFAAIQDEFRDSPWVEEVSYRRGLVETFAALVRILRNVGIIVLIFLLTVTAAIVGNTIRLALYAHRDEIEIMRLVGATDRFVRAPYIIEAIAEGIIAAAVALLLLWGAVLVLRDAVSQSELVQVFLPKVPYLSPLGVIEVFLVSIFLGGLGAVFATRRRHV